MTNNLRCSHAAPGTTTDKDCAVSTCTRGALSPSMFCHYHWERLPDRLQDQIWDTYDWNNSRTTPECDAAYEAALTWLEKLESRDAREGSGS